MAMGTASKPVMRTVACIVLMAVAACSSEPSPPVNRTVEKAAPKYDDMAMKAAENARLDYAFRNRGGEKNGRIGITAASGMRSDVERREIGARKAKSRADSRAANMVYRSQMKQMTKWHSLPEAQRAKTPMPKFDPNYMAKMVRARNQEGR